MGVGAGEGERKKCQRSKMFSFLFKIQILKSAIGEIFLAPEQK